MKKAIATLCKALAQILDAYYAEYDRETSALMTALADWVTKNHDANEGEAIRRNLS